MGESLDTTSDFTFNPRNPELIHNPAALFAEMRQNGGMHFEKSTGRLHVFTHAGAVATLRGKDGSMRWEESQTRRIGRDANQEYYVQAFKDFLDMKNGDDHRRVRQVISKHFRPGRVDALRPAIERRAHELIDEFEQAGTVELMDAFAKKLPLGTISDLLQVSHEDREVIAGQLKHFKLVFQFMPLSSTVVDELNAGLREVVVFFTQLIEKRRQNMGDDLLSDLIRETDAGKLTEAELLANTWGLFAGGSDSTAAAILNAVLTLTEHPDQLELLKDDWSLLSNAVEECLRYDGPGGGALRIFNEEMELEGVLVPPGTPVVAYKQSANLDPEWLPDAGVFDIRRKAVQHLSFGEGLHKCLGLHLARVTIGVAVQALFTRLGDVDVAADGVGWEFEAVPLRNPDRLQLEWEPSLATTGAR
ncbi:cytochrome P450 [Gordonia alkanivorans]|uniref:cytochrome P450 n=1 Tax=Gordonia alkanivorans TaxID=84096 RepID=UPI002446BFE3|nr:cytochrome P450 [Gordonia alkanivorans]MDH3047133.1 cytochrome P450 [Gordonia alkanivorans]